MCRIVNGRGKGAALSLSAAFGIVARIKTDSVAARDLVQSLKKDSLAAADFHDGLSHKFVPASKIRHQRVEITLEHFRIGLRILVAR